MRAPVGMTGGARGEGSPEMEVVQRALETAGPRKSGRREESPSADADSAPRPFKAERRSAGGVGGARDPDGL